MVDLVQSGWAFVILMLSLAAFFGIAIYIYVGYVKGYPTAAGTKIWWVNWSKDVWALILGRQRERAEKKQQEEELAKLAKELEAAHASEVGIKRPPNACLRPNSYMSNHVMIEDVEAQYGAVLRR